MPPGRPKSTKLAPYITISDQRVAWSFIKYVYKRLGCDWDDTIDAFWKAREATGSNAIYRYVMAGFKPGKNRVPWNSTPSKEREAGRMGKIRRWWLNLYTPSAKKRDTLSVKSPEVKTMLDRLSDGMRIIA